MLNANYNDKIDTLQPFAGRLRELQAVCSKLDDVSLVEATLLVKVDVCNNPLVTTVVPFGSTLIELNASHDCGIDTVGLATATNLVCLNASYNPRIQSVCPFASILLELDRRQAM